MNNDGNDKRQGTISSARFNLLSSMVGGGALSLPLAFHQTGNLLVAPLLLVATAALAQRSILLLVQAGLYSTARREPGGTEHAGDARAAARGHEVARDRTGTVSYEQVAGQAFGPGARRLAMALVCATCFFATVGYAVLLRDMLEPIVDALVTPPEGIGGGPTLARNVAMLSVVFCVSPLTTWQHLTALRRVGAASMAAILAVGFCVAYRSLQCQLGAGGDAAPAGDDAAGESALRAFPRSWKALLDAVPLFISSFVCHFNVLPIHNELRCPTSDRVSHWIRTSIWPATLFYYVIGLTGSLFAKCTASASVQGNILLDFDENDPLLVLARLGLATTITLALPMLVIPARDILVRPVLGTRCGRRWLGPSTAGRSRGARHEPDGAAPGELTTVEFEPMEMTLAAPLLECEHGSGASGASEGSAGGGVDGTTAPSIQVGGGEAESPVARTVVALVVFWSAAAIATAVKSIDVVWDLLGSSFSVLLAFLIPCGAFLRLSGRERFRDAAERGLGLRQWMTSRAVARLMILFFAPLMVVSTINACYNQL